MPGRFAKLQRLDLSECQSVVLAGVVVSMSMIHMLHDTGAHAAPLAGDGSNTQEQRKGQAPLAIQLQADRQYYDGDLDLVVASGNVSARINGGLLQADRIEFDTEFNTLAARGSVRFRRGSQYFQASSLRFSLIHNEGVLEDVYGVLDLDSAAIDLNPGSDVRGPSLRDSSQALPSLESSDLGFPTAQQIDLESTTAGRISLNADPTGFWDQTQTAGPDWLVPTEVHAESTEHQSMACPPVLSLIHISEPTRPY